MMFLTSEESNYRILQHEVARGDLKRNSSEIFRIALGWSPQSRVHSSEADKKAFCAVTLLLSATSLRTEVFQKNSQEMLGKQLSRNSSEKQKAKFGALP